MEFIHEIRIHLDILKGENKDCIFYFVGDININLFNVCDNNVIMYCELLAECGLVNLIDGVTRPGKGGGSLIDHIATDTNVLNNTAGITPLHASDHNAVFTILDLEMEGILQNNLEGGEENKNCTYLKTIGFDQLNESLKNEQWAGVFESDKIQPAYASFMETIQNQVRIIISSRKPIKKTYKKKTRWITDESIGLINKRDRLYKKITKEPFNTALKAEYSRLNKLVKSSVSADRKYFYRSKIFNTDNQSYKMWQTVKDITGNNQLKSKIKKITLDSGETADSISILLMF
jgi:hypothetical protein